MLGRRAVFKHLGKLPRGKHAVAKFVRRFYGMAFSAFEDFAIGSCVKRALICRHHCVVFFRKDVIAELLLACSHMGFSRSGRFATGDIKSS